MTTIKRWLSEHGIKQSWLAEKTGVTQSWINKVVNGKAIPTVYDAQRIAKVLGTTVDQLWPLNDEKAPSD